MATFHWVVLGGIAIKMLYDIGDQSRSFLEEENRRKSTPFTFDGRMSSAQFGYIVAQAAKTVKRISWLAIDEAKIHVKVVSQSKLTEWKFTLDFNDFGRFTGNYWITSENHDSAIPEAFGKKIQTLFMEYSKENYHAENQVGYTPVVIPKLTVSAKIGLFISSIIIIAFVIFAVHTIYSIYQEEQSHLQNNELRLPLSSDGLEGRDYQEIILEFDDAGFENIHTEKIEDLIIGLIVKDGEVEYVTVDGLREFSSGDWMDKDAEIIIVYHTFSDDS